MAARNNIIPKELMTPYQRWELASFDEARELLLPVAHKRSVDEPAPLTSEKREAIYAQARQEGYAEGHQQGLQAGRAEAYTTGLQQGQQEIKEVVEQLRQVALSFGADLEQCKENMAPALLNLGLDIAKAMLKTALRVQPELLLPTVNAAIHALTSLQLPALLFLHPDDAVLVREHIGDNLRQDGWRIVEDADLDRGGCRIETGTNQIDATTQTRWSRIAAALGQPGDWLA